MQHFISIAAITLIYHFSERRNFFFFLGKHRSLEFGYDTVRLYHMKKAFIELGCITRVWMAILSMGSLYGRKERRKERNHCNVFHRISSENVLRSLAIQFNKKKKTKQQMVPKHRMRTVKFQAVARPVRYVDHIHP